MKWPKSSLTLTKGPFNKASVLLTSLTFKKEFYLKDRGSFFIKIYIYLENK